MGIFSIFVISTVQPNKK
ncbi:TPA: ErmCL family antibiotic resistance leader peptide [Staphylococcus aureus]|nr:ErmCL family antibiotic resistance leader peptide [Staphylococcus aureus]HDJ3472708.1 ErmCL family antibiotic resistance leader peptide [Staphylococcus aureus]